MKHLARTLALAAAAAFTAAAAFAQAPATTSTHVTKTHHGLMSLLHRPKPGTPHTVRKPIFAGNIIGNRQTHVYHMPGDKGMLPALKNRVYFHTEAQARAAGYRRAGSVVLRRPAVKSHVILHKTNARH